MIDELWGTCVHEASHLVFSRLMQKLDIGFPEPKYVVVKGPEDGAIEAGWFTEFGTPEAERSKKELKAKSTRCHVAQIMYSLAGYSSYQWFIDKEKDKCRFAWVPSGSLRSDFQKSAIVAGYISGNTKNDIDGGTPIINAGNVEIMDLVKDRVKELLQEKNMSQAIILAAEELEANVGRNVEGEKLKVLCSKIDKLIIDVDIEGKIEDCLIALEKLN